MRIIINSSTEEIRHFYCSEVKSIFNTHITMDSITKYIKDMRN